MEGNFLDAEETCGPNVLFCRYQTYKLSLWPFQNFFFRPNTPPPDVHTNFQFISSFFEIAAPNSCSLCLVRCSFTYTGLRGPTFLSDYKSRRVLRAVAFLSKLGSYYLNFMLMMRHEDVVFDFLE